MNQQILQAYQACPYKAWRLTQENEAPEEDILPSSPKAKRLWQAAERCIQAPDPPTPLYSIHVGFTYYRKDWLYRLRNRKRRAVPTGPAAPAATPGSTPSQEKDLFPQVHDLVDEIRALLQG